jgi:hypothetical protein
LNVESTRNENSLVFWNLVWHFYKAKLPYEFILPYENEVYHASYINIQNIDVDLLAFENKECQTEWDLSSVEEALRKYYST